MAARRVQLGVGVGLVLLLGVVLALVLLRDPAGGSPSASPPTQPVPTRPDMDQLRAEAAAAAETLFRKIDEADATGNPAVLDGLYTEGAKAVEEGQKKSTRDRLAQGVVSVKRTRISDVRVDELTMDRALVRLKYQIVSADIRDAKTKKLVERQGSGPLNAVVLDLERIDGRWLVGRVNIEDQS
jgi:hypothetical protein